MPFILFSYILFHSILFYSIPQMEFIYAERNETCFSGSKAGNICSFHCSLPQSVSFLDTTRCHSTFNTSPLRAAGCSRAANLPACLPLSSGVENQRSVTFRSVTSRHPLPPPSLSLPLCCSPSALPPPRASPSPSHHLLPPPLTLRFRANSQRRCARSVSFPWW